MFRPEFQPGQASDLVKGCLESDLKIEKADPAFADGVLVCQGKEFPCHRVLLGARSDVFKKMFLQKQFVEGNNNFESTQIELTHLPHT